MARKITGGLTGSSTLVGTVQISTDAVLSTAVDRSITFRPGGAGDIVMSPAGAGQVTSTAHFQLNTQRGLRFADADSSNYVPLQHLLWSQPISHGHCLLSTAQQDNFYQPTVQAR